MGTTKPINSGLLINPGLMQKTESS